MACRVLHTVPVTGSLASVSGVTMIRMWAQPQRATSFNHLVSQNDARAQGAGLTGAPREEGKLQQGQEPLRGPARAGERRGGAAIPGGGGEVAGELAWLRPSWPHCVEASQVGPLPAPQ